MAPDDLAPDRGLDVGHVEYAGFGRQLGVKHDLEQQVAELAGEVGRGLLAQGVVDLVCLLQQMLLQGDVSLLAIPRAAVRPPQPVGEPRQRPGAGRGQFRRHRAEVERSRKRLRRELAHGRRLCDADPPDWMIGRIEPGQHG